MRAETEWRSRATRWSASRTPVGPWYAGPDARDPRWRGRDPCIAENQAHTDARSGKGDQRTRGTLQWIGMARCLCRIATQETWGTSASMACCAGCAALTGVHRRSVSVSCGIDSTTPLLVTAGTSLTSGLRSTRSFGGVTQICSRKCTRSFTASVPSPPWRLAGYYRRTPSSLVTTWSSDQQTQERRNAATGWKPDNARSNMLTLCSPIRTTALRSTASVHFLPKDRSMSTTTISAHAGNEVRVSSSTSISRGTCLRRSRSPLDKRRCGSISMAPKALLSFDGVGSVRASTS